MAAKVLSGTLPRDAVLTESAEVCGHLAAHDMLRVNTDTLQTYLDFDPIRKIDLQELDRLLTKSAPGLKCYFQKGTPAGEPGMRFKMVGYGKSHYPASSGQQVEWPVVGVALQKNYISVYLSVTKDGAPLVQYYAGRLGECRMARNNFSFVRFDDLNLATVSALLAEADQIFNADPRRRIPTKDRSIPGSPFIRQPASPIRADQSRQNDLPDRHHRAPMESCC